MSLRALACPAGWPGAKIAHCAIFLRAVLERLAKYAKLSTAKLFELPRQAGRMEMRVLTFEPALNVSSRFGLFLVRDETRPAFAVFPAKDPFTLDCPPAPPRPARG